MSDKVYENWNDEVKDRLDYLDKENSELKAQVKKLEGSINKLAEAFILLNAQIRNEINKKEK